MNDIKKKLRSEAPDILKETPVLFAYIYGSFARDLPHRFSDLDIGIFAEGLDARSSMDLELSTALRIDEALEHAVQSEVRILNHLPLAVKGKILSDAELIYSKDEPKRVEFETNVRKAYFDFLPISRMHQKAYMQRSVSG